MRTTNAIERFHEEYKRPIKTQTVLPSAETAAMLVWALLAADRSMREVDRSETLTQRLAERPVVCRGKLAKRGLCSWSICRWRMPIKSNRLFCNWRPQTSHNVSYWH